MPRKNRPTSPATPNREEIRAAAAAGAQAAKERRSRKLITLGVATAAIATLVFTVSFILSSAPDRATPSAGPTADGTPDVTTDTWTLQVGQENAPVRVDVYQDYMCPYCGRFDAANGQDLERLIEEGTVRVEIHPMSFHDDASNGSRYSTRAANAVVTIAQADPARVWAFNEALYRNQPSEGTSGLSDADLAALAVEVGVDQTVADTFSQLTNADWVAQGTQADFDSGIQGTPTVLINGQVFEGDLYSTGPLTAAITAAANG